MKTDYKDVNDNKIEYVGQTNATVKTNKTTLQLPLINTKANITPLMGLDWMKWLEITINPNTEAIKIHNIRMDDNANIIQTKCKYNTPELKTNTNPLARSICRGTEKIIKERISRKSNGNYRRLLRKSRGNNGKEG